MLATGESARVSNKGTRFRGPATRGNAGFFRLSQPANKGLPLLAEQALVCFLHDRRWDPLPEAGFRKGVGGRAGGTSEENAVPAGAL